MITKPVRTPLGPSRLSCVRWLRTGLIALAVASATRGARGADANADCMSCHDDTSLSMAKGGTNVSLFVAAKSFAESVHGGLGCVDCHEGFKPDEMPHAKAIKPVSCQGCHDDAQKVYAQSDHGRALASGVKGAPRCADCHGAHDVRRAADPAARTSRGRESAVCLHCHQDNPEVRQRVVASAGFISSYESSVHGQAVREGDAAATCSDCHGAHTLKKSSSPESAVAKPRIAATCGRCHAQVREHFDASIHGRSVAAGSRDSPTCTDCHGEHTILSHKDGRAPTAAVNLSAQVCSPCHSSVKLTRKYGLAGDRFRSFEDSYHGLAGKAGDVKVANCASCHGVHDILPSSDPRSRIGPANLSATCGECHPGANQNFAKGSVHVVATPTSDRVIFWVTAVYIAVIVLVIGGMLVHNLLDFLKKARIQLMIRRGLLPAKHFVPRLYLRMTLCERLQHATLVLSFITLVLTGFALRFPDSWWVAPFRSISPVMFELRGALHRLAGVVLLLASVFHGAYVVFTARGRQLMRDLWPRWQDAKDAIGVMKYNLGLSPAKPRFGRFSYIEKSEYWALVWGTGVMAATGAILWFDNTFLNLLTKLGVDVAHAVHYYEAWLATLAIIVWHLYFVIFNPDIYPINLAFWSGTLTEEEMEEEHPLELEEIHRRERQDSAPADGSR